MIIAVIQATFAVAKSKPEKKIIILSRVYNEPIQRPAPRWLVTLIGRAMHRYRRGQGLEFPTSLNFSGLFNYSKNSKDTSLLHSRF